MKDSYYMKELKHAQKKEYTMTGLTSKEVEICQKAMRKSYEGRIYRLMDLGLKHADYAIALRDFLKEEYGYTEEEAELIQEGKSKEVLEARYDKGDFAPVDIYKRKP